MVGGPAGGGVHVGGAVDASRMRYRRGPTLYRAPMRTHASGPRRPSQAHAYGRPSTRRPRRPAAPRTLNQLETPPVDARRRAPAQTHRRPTGVGTDRVRERLAPRRQRRNALACWCRTSCASITTQNSLPSSGDTARSARNFKLIDSVTYRTAGADKFRMLIRHGALTAVSLLAKAAPRSVADRHRLGRRWRCWRWRGAAAPARSRQAAPASANSHKPMCAAGGAVLPAPSQPVDTRSARSTTPPRARCRCGRAHARNTSRLSVTGRPRRR